MPVFVKEQAVGRIGSTVAEDAQCAVAQHVNGSVAQIGKKERALSVDGGSFDKAVAVGTLYQLSVGGDHRRSVG